MKKSLAFLLQLVFALLCFVTLSAQAADTAPQPQPQQSQKVDEVAHDFNVRDPNEWVALGKNAGLALAEIAGQLGVAGDKVLDSTSGKIAVALVGAKMLGVNASDIAEIPYRIMAFFIGLVFLFFGVRTWKEFLVRSHDKVGQVDRSDKLALKVADLEVSLVAAAIIPVLLFGFGLVFYWGFMIFFGVVGACILVLLQFVQLFPSEDGNAQANATAHKPATSS